MRAGILVSVVVWGIAMAGPCKMSRPESQSASTSAASFSLQISATASTTSAGASFSLTTSALSTSVPSTLAVSSMKSLALVSSSDILTLPNVSLSTSSLVEISMPSITTESTTASTTESITTSTTTGPPPFVTNQLIGVSSTGLEIPFHLTPPQRQQTYIFRISNGFNNPVPARVAIDAATNRLYAVWPSGEVQWAFSAIPPNVESESLFLFGTPSFITSANRRYVVCEKNSMGFLSCNLDNSFGPSVMFKVSEGMAIPYIFTGPLKGIRATSVDIYLREAVSVPI